MDEARRYSIQDRGAIEYYKGTRKMFTYDRKLLARRDLASCQQGRDRHSTIEHHSSVETP